MTRWYAVHTQAGSELWARSNLWERGIEVYLPRCLKRRRHARRTDWIATPLFPRYLFVRSDLGGGARKSNRHGTRRDPPAVHGEGALAGRRRNHRRDPCARGRGRAGAAERGGGLADRLF